MTEEGRGVKGFGHSDRGRELWRLRGTFASLDDAIEIARSGNPATGEASMYVGEGPAGGYSVFMLNDVPHGFHEGDKIEWSLEKVAVWVPPDFTREAAADAMARAAIGRPKKGGRDES